MKVIIAGSRGFTEAYYYEVICEAMAKFPNEVTEVVSGGCAGPDRCGEKWAKAHNIPVKQFLPNWNEYGKAAGPIRNRQMADYADALVAIWDGRSRGIKNMIEEARERCLKVIVHQPK